MTRQELLEVLGLAHLADRPDELFFCLEEAAARGEGPPPALDPDTAFRVRLGLYVLGNPPKPTPPSPPPNPNTTELAPPAPSLYLDEVGPYLKSHRLKLLRITDRRTGKVVFEAKPQEQEDPFRGCEQRHRDRAKRIGMELGLK